MKHIDIKIACLAILLLLAMRKDLLFFKISNRLILSGILMGLLFNLYETGWIGILTWASGALVPIGLLYLLFLFKVLGAGDIKLFSVIGSFYGVTFVLKSMMIAFILAAVMSVIHLLKYKQVFYRLHYLVNYVQTMVQQNIELHLRKERMVLLPYYDVKTEGYEGVIHFSIAIFAAILLQEALYLFM